jgi:UDP-N-acetylmuramate dehydrogenase
VKSPPFAPHIEEPLGHRTTLGVGGSAQFYSEVEGEPGLLRALSWADERKLPVTVLGGGSNVVIADRGIPGLVLRVVGEGETTTSESEGSVELRVGAGRSWEAFVARAVQRGWAGVECLSGIPGLVGATPIQNVGAYGQEVSESITVVHAFDRDHQRSVDIAGVDCGFGYRTSRFKAEAGDRFIVLGVSFRLTPGGPPCLGYAEVATKLEAAGGTPTLASVRDVVLETRRAKSMLLSDDDANRRSCGSFFVNPIVDLATLENVRRIAQVAVPHFAQADGRFKLPAAWLIEHAGFQRGQRWGAVGISSRHTLALVCHDGARAADVIELARRVRKVVRDRFGIELTPEPRFLGFDTPPGELPSAL